MPRSNFLTPVLAPFHRLSNTMCETDWRDALFKIASDLGFEHTLLAIVPKPGMKLEEAYLRSNYASAWRETYDRQNLAYADPTVAHCIARTMPLIWSPEIFKTPLQRQMYEEAASYGLRAGITLPIHGPAQELGILCLVSDRLPGRQFHEDAREALPELTLLRDIVFESAIAFARPEETPANRDEPQLTRREQECLQWIAEGKTSQEIGRLLGCSAGTVDFHVINLRKKLDARTRREAVLKGIRQGLVLLP